MDTNHSSSSAGITWIVIFLLLGFILAQGFYSFYVVGDMGQPSWDYRSVEDLPGSSPYAGYPHLPFPQHVRGEQGE
jgi:hypothetical protein